MKNNKRRSDCPISFALDIFGDKWSLLIIRDLIFRGKKTYGEFAESEEKISTNILADRLAHLEETGLINVKKDPEKKSRKIYSLTNKGRDLIPLLLEIVKWSSKHDPDTGTPKEFLDRLFYDRENFEKEILMNLED